jgi:tRNA(Ile)-lysidine synthase
VIPALLTLARRTLTDEAKVPRGSRVVAAVSGGPDSMALLHVLARIGPQLGIAVHAHGVDHGLRREAAAELDAAEAFAARLGIPFGRTRVCVPRGGNLQARARAARYAALADAAQALGATAIATAHHADDRAETVLLRLLRGAGPRGLAVLRPRAPLGETGLELLRPLVRARRGSVIAHLERHGVPFATDPSNDDPRYLRTRVRRELMPLLAELSPGIVDHLVALADQLGSEGGEGASSLFPLPRSTQIALAELMRSRSTTARVWLPGGLVVTVDPRAHPVAGARARAGQREAPD